MRNVEIVGSVKDAVSEIQKIVECVPVRKLLGMEHYEYIFFHAPRRGGHLPVAPAGG